MNTMNPGQQWLTDKLMSSADTERKTLRSASKEAELLFIASVCDSSLIRQYVVEPFYKIEDEASYYTYLLSFPGSQVPHSNVDALHRIISGYTAIFFRDSIVLFQTTQMKSAALTETKTEATFQGPQIGFSESLDTNLNLIRMRYKHPSLQTEFMEIGKLSSSRVCLLYDELLADKTVLEQVRQRLRDIKLDALQSAGQLHKQLTREKWTIFPLYLNTERPDRTIMNISRGKIVLFVEGSPFALIIPAVFFDFYSAMDDVYQLSIVSSFLRIIRYLALFINLLLPAAYVALTAYNPEIFRVQLALSIAGSRISVPYPAYVEVMFMLIMMELLLEASMRLPKSVGSTATTVGGLILGQAATQAGLISNIMIIIVSTVAISNFVVPINTMSFSMRIMKYPLLLLASLFGITGLIIGFIALIAYLANLRSFGKPYLKLFFKEK